MTKEDVIRQEAQRLTQYFIDAGAIPVETSVLQPADALLDLYGEDIRARAYVTSDVARGEQMLRPDFTVPVTQAHMRKGGSPAKYTYCGKVFRRQDDDETRANEYLQVGYEFFTHHDQADADAQVFALFYDILAPYDLRVTTGDMGILIAAVEGLKTTDQRKATLMRHIWRPDRFRAVLERYAQKTHMDDYADLFASSDPMAQAGPVLGLRTADQITARIDRLRDDANAAPISTEEVALIDQILATKSPADQALVTLSGISDNLPSIRDAVARYDQRLLAIAVRGTAADQINFDATYGQTQMEYYDGFIFGFYSSDNPSLPPVASGGRYDALTRQLGNGEELPAIGGVIRPAILASLGEPS